MAFGFPASHTEQFSPPQQDRDICVGVKQTFAALNWNLRKESADTLVASIGSTLLSRGYRITVRVLANNSIVVTSKATWPTEVFDWGRNAANVRKFMAEYPNSDRTHLRSTTSRRILGMRRNFIGFVAIFFYTIGPMLSVLLASAIANALGCRLDEASVHPCDCYGVDIGGLLSPMFVMGWLLLVTLPTGVMAMVVFVIWVAATAWTERSRS